MRVEGTGKIAHPEAALTPSAGGRARWRLYRLPPNRVAIGLRLLARTLAIGHQMRATGARPEPIREPTAFRAAHVAGLGTFRADRQTIVVTPVRAAADDHDVALPWADCPVRDAA